MTQKENQALMVQAQEFNLLDPQCFDTAQRAAKMLASSDLVPDRFKAKTKAEETKAIANCVIALDMAQRLKANPLMVMQNMYIVYGQPAWSSKFLIATINACGRYESLHFEISQNGEVTYNNKKIPNIECVCWTRERGKEEKLVSARVNIAMAISEGWYGKNGSKWQTMPEQMLRYRSASFWCNVYAPEISMGIMTQEEVTDVYEVVEEKPKQDKVTINVDDIDTTTGEVVTKEVKKEESKPQPQEVQEKVNTNGEIVFEQQPEKADF